MKEDLTRWDPLDDFRVARRWLDRLAPWSSSSRFEPAEFEESLPVNIYDQGENLVVRAAVPGVKPEDIDVSVNDGTLDIRAESKREDEVNERDYYRREFRYGRIHRSFRLPAGVDASKVEASYDNGMLEVTIPRAPEAKAQRIEVKGT